MVGLIPELTLEDLDQASKPKNSKDPPDPVDPKSNDLSFADSFLDFESIEDWFKDLPNPGMAETGQVTVEVVEVEYGREETGVEGQALDVYDPIDGGFKPVLDGYERIDCGAGCAVKVEDQMPEKLSCSIVEELGKVSLIGGCDESLVIDGGNGVRSERFEDSSVLDDKNGMKSPENGGSESLRSKSEGENGGRSEIVSGNGAKSEAGSDESQSESGSSESSSSSSSSSSSDDGSSDDDDDDMDEEEAGKGKLGIEAGEIEEGEIRDADGGVKVDKEEDEDDDSVDDDDAVVAWTDADTFDDVDEEEDDVGAPKGPIRSKNELEVLPPIPPVNVTLQQHHQTQPVGVVLSIIGTQVIVEGVEKHNPLNEGSILWITESRSPLGLIDEIFGPVISPYYVVRYNSESEIPAGIQGGTLVSFVPEFADHVLNNKDVYKKGYDASGANDEEVSDEAEFSDDEKEAEHRRMQKLTKRGMNDQNLGNKKNNRKKVRNKTGPWKNGQPSPQKTPMDMGQLPPNHHHQHFSPAAPSLDHGYCPSSSSVPQGFASGSAVQPFPAATHATGVNATSNVVWTNGMPFQPQNTSFPSGFPNNGLPWPLPYNHQYPYQMSMPDRLPFYQQADSGQRLPGLPGDQLNAFLGPMFPRGLVGQHGFNQTTFGLGLQGQPPSGQQFNAFAGPMYSHGPVGQPGFNQNSFGIGVQGQPTHPTLPAAQVMLSSGRVEQNCNMPQPAGIAGNVENQQFNPGTSSNRGRKPPRRGGHNFARGRGWQQSR